jgi:hypothetical protein
MHPRAIMPVCEENFFLLAVTVTSAADRPLMSQGFSKMWQKAEPNTFLRLKNEHSFPDLYNSAS